MTRLGRITCLAILLSVLFCGLAESQTSVTAQQLVDRGNSFAAERQFDKAVESYKEAIKLDPNLALAHLGLGSVLNSIGRAGESLEPMKTAVLLDPKNARGYLNLGMIFMNLRRPDEALAALNEAKLISPSDPRVYNMIGNLMHDMGRFEDAITYYRKAIELDPNNAADFHNIGLMYMRLGKFANAIEPLKTALRLTPNYQSARYHLSNAYSRTGRFLEAIDSWTKYLERSPKDLSGLSSRAWNYLYEGNYGREAALDAQKYLSLYGWRDESSPFQACVAILGFRAAGMEPDAQAVILQALKKVDPDVWAYNIIRFFGSQIDGEELLKIAANNDQRTEAHTYVGMDLRIKGRSKEARTHFQWVKDFGNGRFLEYPLAIVELGRLPN